MTVNVTLSVGTVRQNGFHCLSSRPLTIVLSDDLRDEGGALVVGRGLDAVAVLVARRQLEPLVADLYDGRLRGIKDYL